MANQKPSWKKLHGHITWPIDLKAEAYWKCPGKGCEYYQTVFVGLLPEKLAANISCPACNFKYKLEFMARVGAALTLKVIY